MPDSTPKFPQPFGTYRLLRSLGSGGMGDVYLAEDPKKGNRLVVIKTLRGHLAVDREYVTRFVDEARLLVHLDHPNICRVFDSGCIGGRYFLAMEAVSGWDARTLVERSRALGEPLPEGLALFIMSQVLAALDSAHRAQDPTTGKSLELVHRDVSPQNVMVSFEGIVKLIDFGLARSTVKREVTKPEVVMGKLHYMSPEHARGGLVGPTADQFAAAVVTYELVAGEPFYGDMSTHEVWHVAGRGGFVPPLWRSLHPSLQAVLGRALATDPSERYASCADMRDALIQCAAARRLASTQEDLSTFVKDVYVAHLGAEAERIGAVPPELSFVERGVASAPAPSLDDVQTDGAGQTAPLGLDAATIVDVELQRSLAEMRRAEDLRALVGGGASSKDGASSRARASPGRASGKAPASPPPRGAIAASASAADITSPDTTRADVTQEDAPRPERGLYAALALIAALAALATAALLLTR